MMIAPSAFTPLPKNPQIIQKLLSAYAGEPVNVTSHGWQYVLTGNTLLDPKRLRGIILEGQDPSHVVGRLLSVYREAGYFLVGISAEVKPIKVGYAVPQHEGPKSESHSIPKTHDKGMVHLFIIEGRITHEKVPLDLHPFYAGLGGNPRLKTDQVIRRGILAGLYAQRTGQALQPSIGPAAQPGGSFLKVETKPMTDYRQVSGLFQVGNYGSRYLSTYVTGLSLNLYPGDGAQLTADYLAGQPDWTRDSRGSAYRASGFGYNVVTSYGIYGGKLQVTHYALGQIAAPLYNVGNIIQIGLTGRQLIFANTSSQFWLAEGFHRVSNNTTVYGGQFTLLAQQYNYLSLGVDYRLRSHLLGEAASVQVNYRYNQGISPRSGTFSLYTAKLDPTPRFGYQAFNLTLQQALPFNFMGRLTLGGQWAYATLPQEQQWVLGGFGNLSAYHPGLMTGDSGYALRYMLQAPSQRFGIFDLSPDCFLEMGGVRYRYGNSAWIHATDYGVGLSVGGDFGASLNMLYAKPLNHPGLSDTVADSQVAGLYAVFQQPF